MRAVVVGHVEWITFLRVDRAPAPGSISLASEWWDEAAGGGGVAAAELARLAGSCTLVTAVGSDPTGAGIRAALAEHGVSLCAAVRAEPHRRGITLLDPSGERTIVVQGDAQSARGDDPDVHAAGLAGADAVYFCKGDAAIVRAARAARVLVATARTLPVLQQAGVALDALVHSARDPSERYAPGDLDPAPRLVATTDGSRGGAWRTADGRSGAWAADPLPGALRDTYGAGDCFAAGLAYALAASGADLATAVDAATAVAFAAARGALALTRRGAHGGPSSG